jgi:tetratricopeptide (TPR) repeat protein
MKIIARLFRFGAVGIAVFTLGGATLLRGQAPASDPAPARPEELTQAELLKAYQQVREQLLATQQAIANSRAEAETAARAQAAALTEKLDSIKSALDAERERYRIDREWQIAERERQQAAMERANAERERRQAEIERSNQTLLWIAASFGAVGLMAMLVTPLLQWRAINRIAAATEGLRQLGDGERNALLPGDADPTVGVSTKRLMSALDRMEQRIFELEHTSSQPGTVTVKNRPNNGTEAVRRADDDDKSQWIAVLLNKGQTFLNTNKAIDALACFDEILKLELNHPEALVKRGSALERLKQDEEAIQCYDRAIKADRHMTLAYLYKGGVCNRLERYEEALKCYEQALRVEEESTA